MMRKSLFIALAAGILLSGCGGKRRVAIAVPARIGAAETGIASWYGVPYHGRRAASGEIYDMEQMTAAHRTLPFGTWLQVKNLTNNKIVNVRVIDRGPFVSGRIIDLSHAAATSLDMIGPGTARVKLTVIAPPVQVAQVQTAQAQTARVQPVAAVEPPTGLFAVQVGSFADRRNADRVRAAMEKRYGTAKLAPRDGQPPHWRVLVGREASEEAAEALAARIRMDAEAGPAGAFVVRLDLERVTD